MPFQSVQPPLPFLAPQFKPWILKPLQWLSPLWLRWQRDVTHIEVHNIEQLAHSYDAFYQGKSRLIIAFRHPTIDDPVCLMHLLGQELPRCARRLQLNRSRQYHAHFIYDRGLPVWLGSLAKWILPRLGASPIHRGKLDRVGLRTARELLLNGQFPLAIAPEGTINGHNQILNPLEPGTAQLAFWGLEDIQKAGQDQEVAILPIGLRYHYSDSALPHIQTLIEDLNQMAGYPDPTTTDSTPTAGQLYIRLLKLSAHLLHTTEDFYREYYGSDIPQDPIDILVEPSSDSSVETLLDQLLPRLRRLLDIALTVSEQRLYLKPRDTLVDRRHAIEQAGWDRVFRSDIEDIDALAPAQRGLADHLAHEAFLLMWHMRLVETFIGIAGQTIGTRPLLDRLAETTLQIWRLLLRMQNQDPLSVRPPYLGPRDAHITVGHPILLRHQWEAYQSSRRQAVAALTQDLQKGLEAVMSVTSVSSGVSSGVSSAVSSGV